MKENPNKNSIKKYLLLFILIIMVAVSQSLGLKANIGVCACWDSVSLNVYEIWGLKVGTFSIIANCFCVLIQLVLLRKEFSPFRLLQVPLVIVSGLMVNFMYYNVLDFEITAYWIRVVFLLLSYIGLAVFVGAMTIMEIITMPLEAACYVINRRYGISFSKLRMSADVICIAASLLLSLVFGLSLKVREGTLIGFVLLGPLMGQCMKWEKRLLDKRINI